MNAIKSSQLNFISLKRHILFVMFICYIPHIITQPWWLFLMFLAAIGYRLFADYFSYPPLPIWIRSVLVLGCLFLLNQDVRSGGFIIRFLLMFIILKTVEFHTVRDLKVLILCNFFLIFSALIVIQEFWIILYLLIAILANLSIMLKLSTPEFSFREMSGKSSQQLLIAIPLCILLFYIFPRIDPLWKIPPSSAAGIGFNEKMSFGSISELFNQDHPVMQITFKKSPILNGYWRGVVLSFYTGESWIPAGYNELSFEPLPELKNDDIADYEILLEPSQTKWLFYIGYPIAGGPNLLFSSKLGLTRQTKEASAQRFSYAMKVKPPPYYVLNAEEYNEAIQLPKNINPQLNIWAKEQFAKTGNHIQAFIAFLHDYIRRQPFHYTLMPPILNSSKNQMDSFWFSTQKGFCEHYASAVTFILRSAGIPAHVVVGYQGGEWNPITGALMIQQSNAHAWLEYWQEGVGWQQLDPTLFIAPERIDPTIRNRQMNQLNFFNISELPWQHKIKFFFESVRFYSQRWFLFYNQNTQQTFLQNIGLGQWNKAQLLQTAVGCMILFFILVGLYYHLRQRQTQDALLFEYQLLLKQFRRLNVSTHSSATLIQLCKSLLTQVPELAPVLASFIDRYEQLRLKQSKTDSKQNKKETIALFKTLRYMLRRRKFI